MQPQMLAFLTDLYRTLPEEESGCPVHKGWWHSIRGSSSGVNRRQVQQGSALTDPPSQVSLSPLQITVPVPY